MHKRGASLNDHSALSTTLKLEDFHADEFRNEIETFEPQAIGKMATGRQSLH